MGLNDTTEAAVFGSCFFVGIRTSISRDHTLLPFVSTAAGCKIQFFHRLHGADIQNI